jgi:DNA-binding NarL/FixJ family response regulator
MTRTAPVQVLIASENRLFRECLADRVGREKPFRVIGEASDSAEVRSQIKKSPPNVLVLDTDGLGGIPDGLISHVHSQWPDVKVLVLIPRANDHLVARLLQQGAAGVLPRSEGLSLLFRALEMVAIGRSWAGREAMARALTTVQRMTRQSPRSLTPRERQLLSLLGDGYRNKELANLLHIKEQTVKIHLHSLFRKLNVRSRVEAALKATELD